MPKVFLVRKLRHHVKGQLDCDDVISRHSVVVNGNKPITNSSNGSSAYHMGSDQDSPYSPTSSSGSSVGDDYSIATNDSCVAELFDQTDQPLALSLKRGDNHHRNLHVEEDSDEDDVDHRQTGSASPPIVSVINRVERRLEHQQYYRPVSPHLATLRWCNDMMVPPVAHQQLRNGVYVTEEAVRPVASYQSVIKQAPPSADAIPKIANAPINLSSNKRHRDVYPVSPTPASPFKPYEEIIPSGHGIKRSAQQVTSSSTYERVGGNVYYDLAQRPSSVSPPLIGQRPTGLNGQHELTDYEPPSKYFRSMSTTSKDDVSVSSSDDLSPVSPTSHDGSLHKGGSEASPTSMHLRLSMIQQQLRLPDNCHIEFVNGGHGIKNPLVSHSDRLESMDVNCEDSLMASRDSASSSTPATSPQLSNHSSGGDNRFACSICSKVFSLQRLLNRHMKCHSDVKRYLCTFCGKGFNDTFDLKRHTRTHTGVRPYKCNHCEKSFTQRCSLESHTLKVHGIQHKYAYKERRTKVYVCEECGHTTNEPEMHYLHLKENHPYSPALLKFYDKRHFKFNGSASYPPNNCMVQVRS
ncbi:hypothetical protein CHUAL_006981 [Chamberlinius hualienensis]